MGRNIAIIGPAWPYRGGLANFNERLAREWMKRGDNATIHTFTRQYPDFLFPGTSQFTDHPPPADLKIHRSIHAYNPLNWTSASKEIRQLAYDLVLIRYWIPAMAPALGFLAHHLVNSSNTRVVALVDNLYPHEARPLDRWLTHYFLRQPHAFVTMSAKVATQLRPLAQGKPVCTSMHPIYDDYGPEIEKIEARRILGLDPKVPVLLFFGFIRKYKGLDLLIEALADPRLKAHSFRVVVAGEWYEDATSYKQQAMSADIEGRIIWRDHFIPESDIPTYFSAADAVIQPYRNATQSGISALALAYSKPLISTNVGGLAEIVSEGETGFLCEPDSLSIGSAILRWLDTAGQDKLSHSIRELRKQMSWEKLIDVIESCL